LENLGDKAADLFETKKKSACDSAAENVTKAKTLAEDQAKKTTDAIYEANSCAQKKIGKNFHNLKMANIDIDLTFLKVKKQVNWIKLLLKQLMRLL
jgi:hypothetical protein